MKPKEKNNNWISVAGQPIALTDTSYKIFIGLIKKEIKNYLENNLFFKDTQAGFTKKQRIEENLFILNECKDMAQVQEEKTNCSLVYQ